MSDAERVFSADGLIGGAGLPQETAATAVCTVARFLLSSHGKKSSKTFLIFGIFFIVV